GGAGAPREDRDVGGGAAQVGDFHHLGLEEHVFVEGGDRHRGLLKAFLRLAGGDGDFLDLGQGAAARAAKCQGGGGESQGVLACHEISWECRGLLGLLCGGRFRRPWGGTTTARGSRHFRTGGRRLYLIR